MARQFAWNERLGISVPSLTQDWEEMSRGEQSSVLEVWETIRGKIPDHVKRFEEQIKRMQDALFEEDDFAASCRLNGDIADLASRINDLHIWFRTQQDLDEEGKRHG
ncbi:hypothetical protein E5161_13370 [Cohnella pontilimi]|uniref:Uncharacterized protein n=1 Tax=Cohnella pontilimi TaxID=2564100 RepID=A0A4U0FA57_9BACL|nr:hypothetical protein [Cohnella pontilimi]TJY41597.1 hypothetical protein E5161_13370 [Cohnella pontilimi]